MARVRLGSSVDEDELMGFFTDGAAQFVRIFLVQPILRIVGGRPTSDHLLLFTVINGPSEPSCTNTGRR